MRVCVAFDGSTYASTAVELTRALPWPSGSLIRVVQVLPTVLLFGGVPVPAGPAGERAAVTLATSVERLRRDGLTVESRVLEGESPAALLLLEARQFAADIIITGHRGHGAMATAFLGSVARDLGENAHCPVLVARRPTCERIVLAEDGSEPAFAARRLLATWPMFRGKAVRVVSVPQLVRPLLSGIAVAVREEARAEQDEIEIEARVAYRRLATETAEELAIAGLRTSTDVRSGDPAEQIVAAASASDADMIVMGTRGRGALTRVLLGSVARAVLLSAPCSVLVVRPT